MTSRARQRKPQTPRHRRVARRRRRRSRAISARTSSSSRASATSATFRSGPPTSRRSTKGQPWARLGVDVEHGFEPIYVVDPDKKKKVNELKKLLASSDELLLATDEDREGEAIAWHLMEVLKPKVPVSRMVFHEITRDAIERALGETRDVDQRLVDAQETRRDPRPALRLRGLAGPLEEDHARSLAGRVQSVATRLVVERERERMKFVSSASSGPSRRRSTPSRSLRGSSGSTASASRRAATSGRTES